MPPGEGDRWAQVRLPVRPVVRGKKASLYRCVLVLESFLFSFSFSFFLGVVGGWVSLMFTRICNGVDSSYL